MEREILEGRLYRHFKGHTVKVLYNSATHSETLERYVIYQKSDTGKIWVRPFDMFASEVDHGKYPDVKQKYRFELVDD